MSSKGGAGSKPPDKKPPKGAKEEKKQKKHIYTSANAGNSGGPVIDVKAWKAAQKAAAAGGGGGAAAEEDAKKAERQKRFAGNSLAAACDESAKMALATVKKSDKKGEVVKGFVGELVGGAKGGGGGKDAGKGGGEAGKKKAAEEEAPLLAAVPKGQYFEKTPRHLLQEFCQKNKVSKPKLMALEEKGGSGFKGKVVIHASSDSDAQVRTTEQSYPSSEEAQQQAAVMGLFLVAGDRRMDRILPVAYRSAWKSVEDAESQRKVGAEQREKKRDEMKEREERREKIEKKQTKLFMSEEIANLIISAVRQLESAKAPPPPPAEDVAGQVVSELVSMGFSRSRAQHAVDVSGSSDKSSALDWLCIHCSDQEMPSLFKSRSAMPFQIHAPVWGAVSSGGGEGSSGAKGSSKKGSGKGGGGEQSLGSVPGAASAKDANPIGEREVLMALGWDEGEAEDAAGKGGKEAMSLLLSKMKLCGSEGEVGGGGELSEDAAEEKEALEAIYGDEFRQEEMSGGGGYLWTVKSGDIELEACVGPEYPNSVPLHVTVKGGSMTTHAALWMSNALHETCRGLVGSAMMFELVSWAEANLHDQTCAMEEACVPLLKSGIDRGGGGGGAGGGGEGVKSIEDDEVSEAGSGLTEDTVLGAGAGGGGGKGRGRGGGGRGGGAGGGGGRGFGSADAIAANSKRLLDELKSLEGQAKYKEMVGKREKLPAHQMREGVVAACRSNQILLVCGSTGCGKTTQVPQFILEEAFRTGQGGKCNIICTQPRRISAIGVSERVAQERCCSVGGLVGYQIRLESKKSRDTRLLFCTTGLLLRRLMDDSDLEGVSHVVVDEVHERTIDGDFLLILLRRLCKRRSDLRVVLMSATADANKFSRYFGGCPVVTIPGFTHPVKEYHLEEALRMTGQLIGRGSAYALPRDAYLRRKKLWSDMTKECPPGILGGDEDEREGGEVAAEKEDEGGSERLDHHQISLLNVDESQINYDLFEGLLEHFHKESPAFDAGPNQKGTVLIFLPGLAEIQRALDRVTDLAKRGTAGALWPVPVHGSLTPAEQQKVFQSPPGGARKVVLATNICETSITIDDCIVVIDTGRARSMSYDPEAGLSRLMDGWIDRAAGTQRAGRAGRVRPGSCFRTYTKSTQRAMDAHQAPEMLRVSVEGLCLQILAMGFGPVHKFLAEALDTPPSSVLDAAVKDLKEVGAIRKEARGEWELTELGGHLARMPVDTRLARMLVFAAVFGCVEPALTIAATMSARSPFVAPFDQRDAANRAKESFAKDKDRSDHVLYVRVFEAWCDVKGRGGAAERSWCRENFLSSVGLRTISDLRGQFVDVLVEAGFLGGRGQNAAGREASNSNADNLRVLRAVICAGLYPNVVRVERPDTRYADTSSGAIAQAATAKELRMFTRGDGRVFLHPSSINFRQGDFTSPWLVYHTKRATSKIFIQDSSMVTPFALLLFGGEIDIVHQYGELVMDGWVKMLGAARVLVLVKRLRGILDQALKIKFASPTEDISGHVAMKALMKVLEFE